MGVGCQNRGPTHTVKSTVPAKSWSYRLVCIYMVVVARSYYSGTCMVVVARSLYPSHFIQISPTVRACPHRDGGGLRDDEHASWRRRSVRYWGPMVSLVLLYSMVALQRSYKCTYNRTAIWHTLGCKTAVRVCMSKSRSIHTYYIQNCEFT